MQIFQRKFPNIDFEIGNSESMSLELETKRYDFIITAGSIPDDTYSYSPLFQDQMVCILPPHHSLGTQPYVRLQDFRKINLIKNFSDQRILNPKS